MVVHSSWFFNLLLLLLLLPPLFCSKIPPIFIWNNGDLSLSLTLLSRFLTRKRKEKKKQRRQKMTVIIICMETKQQQHKKVRRRLLIYSCCCCCCCCCVIVAERERTDGRTENARIGNVSGHFFYDALLQTVEQTPKNCDPKNNNGIRATGPRHRISVVIAKDGLNRGVSLSTNSREYRDDCAHVRCDASPAPFSWTARF